MTENAPTAAPVEQLVGPILRLPVPLFGWVIANANGIHFVFGITFKRADAWKRFEDIMGDCDGDYWIGRTTFRAYWKSKGYCLRRVRCEIV